MSNEFDSTPPAGETFGDRLQRGSGFNTDTVYIDSDGTVFFSPDGEGRMFYDTVEEAADESGLDKVTRLVAA